MLSKSRSMLLRNFPGVRYLVRSQGKSQQTLPILAKSISISSTTLTKEYDHALPISEIPGPLKVPVLGNVYQMKKAGGMQHFDKLLQQMKREYGDIFQLKFGSERMVCLADPDMIEDAFRKEGKYPRREKTFPAWTDYHKKRNMPLGVFVAQDEEWQRQRSALNPKLLNIKHVEHYTDDFNKVIDQFLHKLISLRDHDMEIEHIEKHLFKWSLESVCTVLFETHLGCFSKNSDPRYDEFIDAVHTLMDVVMELYFDSSIIDKVIESDGTKQFKHSLDVIYRVAGEEIDRKLKKYKDGTAKPVGEDTAKEFIPYLYYVQEQKLAEIKSNIASLMMAAVETTSTSMQFLLFNLANNQKVQTKLHEEISTVLKPDEPATPETLKKMPYMKAVMKESHRLSPAVPVNMRWFAEDRCIAGYVIPAKTSIFLLHDEVCHDEKHFDKPEAFRPERWLRDGKEEQKIHPFASLPFGYGVRGCLGKRLAELELQLLLSRIFGKYVVECDKKTLDTECVLLINRPDESLKFKFYER
eukprot:gene16875-18580_t